MCIPARRLPEHRPLADGGATRREGCSAKPLKGFSGAGVLEIVEDYRGATYRAVYTVRLASAVYVLHCFQKKSPRGGQVPRLNRELMEKRLRDAEKIEKEGA